MSNTGKVYLIPTVLADEHLETIPAYVTGVVRQLKIFFVENERTARRYMKALDRSIVIDDLQLYPMNNNQPPDVALARKLLLAGHNIGMMSEAGCPAIADPGHLIVGVAHQVNAPVMPLVGPNSILLALMASGMNGQQFAFTGYLPVDKSARVKALKELEQRSAKWHQTQIFIETPYRNNALFTDLLAHCAAHTLLCVAVEITGNEQFILTKTVGEWKRLPAPELHKRPAIFLLYVPEAGQL
ncbi:16S rRNA (cytidine1402-2'-O)-methyltransferase [Chitinophaga costaii]|uniref:16S rRNA (Cytidine1402-2'-O)-methyltransferase n=1 Tax=Chitinophaga costaii TaxID=1335309 RepID=A0A1C4G4B3_9BACT|nr:SAM-dependent methyltransferase [Chitinophaga costaii]PUZ22045.1 SAM-dependent methyltransferase [Chitinophaga costaii]SCC63020.1 16S rRNA (cytidine1402-2'-O)-methyltransferase [Chitinophaga costaii]